MTNTKDAAMIRLRRKLDIMRLDAKSRQDDKTAADVNECVALRLNCLIATVASDHLGSALTLRSIGIGLNKRSCKLTNWRLRDDT